MKLINLFESPQDDLNYRNSAMKVINQITRNLRSNGLSSYTFSQKFNVYWISLANISDLPIKLIIRPTLDDRPDIVAGYDDSINAVQVFIQGDHTNPRVVLSFITSNISIIVHEIIHYYDSHRSDYNIPSSSAMDDKGYYNNAGETNAYYNERLSELEGSVFNKIFQRKEHWNKLRSFDFIRELFWNGMDMDFKKYISDTNKKKLDRRLYRYFTDIILKHLDKLESES